MKKSRKKPDVTSAGPQSGNPSGRFTLIAFITLIAALIPASLIDFPPGDSWTHGWMVREWAHCNFVFNDWSSAIALPQQVLGWMLHVNAENVNWTILSVMTALVTVLGCAFVARLPSVLYPKHEQLKSWAPLMFFVCLAPTFTLKIAAGFMTDGYYLFFLAASLWMLVNILTDSTEPTNALWVRRWVGFAALATLASLQRTHGVTLLFIVAVWILFAKVLYRGKESDERFSGWKGWFPVILCLVGFIFALLVIKNPEFSPARSLEVTEEIKNFWMGKLMSYPRIGWDRLWLAFGILAHIGLVLLPVTLIARHERTTVEKNEGKRVINWWYVGFGAAFLLMVLVRWSNGSNWGLESMFPYIPNSLTPEGFGPRGDTIALTSGHQLDSTIRVILTVLGAGGGIILIWLMSRTVRLRGIDWRAPSTLVGLIGLAHIGLIFVNLHFFDRYLLPLIPFALCWIAPLLKTAPAKSRLAGWILVVIFMGWALWGTYDALNWTSAKWDLASEAIESGIPSNQLVGGYEPDGYFNYTNETYPGLNSVGHPAIPWWVTRLGLQTAPVYVILEKDADVIGTPWERYVPYELENDRMQVWVIPEIFEEYEEIDSSQRHRGKFNE